MHGSELENMRLLRLVIRGWVDFVDQPRGKPAANAADES